MTVLLPQQTATQIGMAGHHSAGSPPVLYLLHGLSDDDTIWLRRTSIERYVAPLGLAVVMPQVHRSYYTDEAYGGRYWTFLSEELPQLVDTFFRLSTDRRDTFVAGLSMGGYGAIKWALRQPHRFAAAASLSGVLDVAAGEQGTAERSAASSRGSSATRPSPARRTTCSGCVSRSSRMRCRRCGSDAGPRTRCTARACASWRHVPRPRCR